MPETAVGIGGDYPTASGVDVASSLISSPHSMGSGAGGVVRTQQQHNISHHQELHQQQQSSHSPTLSSSSSFVPSQSSPPDCEFMEYEDHTPMCKSHNFLISTIFDSKFNHSKNSSIKRLSAVLSHFPNSSLDHGLPVCSISIEYVELLKRIR